MARENFTVQTIGKQLSQRSGQIGISRREGGYEMVDDLSGKALVGQSASSTLLANPQRPNDPKIKAQALDIARGYYSGRNVPQEFIETIASVAAYISAVRGTPVSSLITPTSVSLELLQAYNAIKPKGSQVGQGTANLAPSWTTNPTLRGSISAAITDQV